MELLFSSTIVNMKNFNMQKVKRKYERDTPVCMAEAVDAVRTGRMTERKAAEHYGITRSRLQNHLSGKHQGSCGHHL